nr:ALPV-027 [Albatrosspox virus]
MVRISESAPLCSNSLIILAPLKFPSKWGSIII